MCDLRKHYSSDYTLDEFIFLWSEATACLYSHMLSVYLRNCCKAFQPWEAAPVLLFLLFIVWRLPNISTTQDDFKNHTKSIAKSNYAHKRAHFTEGLSQERSCQIAFAISANLSLNMLWNKDKSSVSLGSLMLMCCNGTNGHQIFPA